MTIPPELHAAGILPVPTPSIIAEHLPAEVISSGIAPHDLRALAQWAKVSLAAALVAKIKGTYKPCTLLKLSWDYEVEVDGANRHHENLLFKIKGSHIGASLRLQLAGGHDFDSQINEHMAALLVALGMITVDAAASEEQQLDRAITVWRTMASNDPAITNLKAWAASAIEFARVVRDLSGSEPLPIVLGE